MTARSDYQECKYCRTRIIFPRNTEGKKLPPVNYGPDPQGTVAVWHDVSGWLGLFLAAGQNPAAPAHKHALHWCDGLARQKQRGQWTSAMSELHAGQRRNRWRRPAKPVTGYVVQPEQLPGMGEQ